MNAAEFHLLLNHLPVLIPILGFVILAAGLGLKSKDIQKTGLCVLVAAGLFALPTYFTGEPAEDLVKNYPGVSRVAIHEHEEAGLWALVVLGLAAVVAAVAFGLMWKKKSVPRAAWGLLLLLSALACLAMARTAHFGGLIRHEEIQTPQERERFDAGQS